MPAYSAKLKSGVLDAQQISKLGNRCFFTVMQAVETQTHVSAKGAYSVRLMIECCVPARCGKRGLMGQGARVGPKTRPHLARPFREELALVAGPGISTLPRTCVGSMSRQWSEM